MASPRKRRRDLSVPVAKSQEFDRRSFIKTTGGVVVAAALGACGDPQGPGEETGTVEVQVSGLATATAGSVTFTLPDGSDAGVTLPLPDAVQGVSFGIATNVPVGTYWITYSPPANHDVTDPDDFEDVTVEANQTARAVFTVAVLTGTTGTLEVRVSGLAGSAAAGTATVTTLDGGDPGISIVLPDADTQGVSLGVAANVPVDTYRITYGPPSAYGITDPDDVEEVTVVAGQTARADFTVQLLAALAFASDWATALGTSSNAIGDGGLWATLPNGISNPTGIMEVISASGLNFPSSLTNVCRLNINGGGAWIGYANADLGTLATGNTRYWRVYFRNAINAVPGGFGKYHPLQMGDRGGNVAFWLRYAPNNDSAPGTLTGSGFEFHTRAGTHAWSLLAGDIVGDLDRDTTYRLEWAIERLAAPDGKYGILSIRVYDSSDVLLANTADFGCTGHWSGGAPPTDHHLDQAVEDSGGNLANMHWTEDEDWTRTGGMRLVCPGDDYGDPSYSYWGGYAVSDSNWCGAYVAGEGP